jgi:hypothetical protein
MAQIDIDEVKRVSAELSTHRLPQIGIPQTSGALTQNGMEIQKILKSYFDKTGLDTDTLNKLTADRQTERRKLFEKQVADSAKNLNKAQIDFRQAMETQREALQLLATPYQSTFITLDKPFLIWQIPHPELDIFIDSHIEPLNSSVKISAHKHAGGDSTSFTFYFLWQNPSEFAAVVNVKTSLVLNGFCQVIAASGFFSGHANFLDLRARLDLLRNGGWGTDPTTGVSNNQTLFPSQPIQRIKLLQAKGGDLLSQLSGDWDEDHQPFTFEPFPLSRDLIVIPAAASILFEVSLDVSYSIEDGGAFDDVIIDFASDDFDRRVICPMVALELLTPPAVLTAT